MRLGGGIIFVGTGGVGEDGGVELRGELAAEGGHAELGVACDFFSDGFVVDGFDGLAELVGEVFEEGVELGFELFGASFLLGAAFEVELDAGAGEFALALLEVIALGGGGGELVVEGVEEGADIGSLGGHLGAGCVDDGRVEAETGGDVESCGGSGDAEAELVGGGEGLLVEAYGGVEDSGVVGGIDLERGEVGGDDAPGVEGEEVGGDSDGEGCAFFGVSGGAEFVEEDEGVCGCVAGDAVEVDDVGGEAGEIALDGLGVADVGVDGVEEREVGLLGGDGDAGLGHDAEETKGLEGDRLAAGVGAADDELAGVAREDDGERDGGLWGFVVGVGEGCGSHAELEERVAGIGEGELGRFGQRDFGGEEAGVREGGAGAVEGVGEGSSGGVGFDFGEDAGAGVNGGGVVAEGAGHGDEDAMDL